MTRINYKSTYVKMCIHRKEVCTACKCPIEDMIVLCPDIKRRWAMTNPMMQMSPKAIAYTPENVRMITSMYPHEMPTVERSTSLCRTHYTIIMPNAATMPYENYREKMNLWMRM